MNGALPEALHALELLTPPAVADVAFLLQMCTLRLRDEVTSHGLHGQRSVELVGV